MTEHATTTYGLDLGDKKSVICVLSAAGEVLEESRIATTSAGLSNYFQGRPSGRVVLEVGTHSPWVSRLLKQLGHEVIVANALRVKLISQNHRKDDKVDAELLARLGRVDPELLSPIYHRGEETQGDIAMIRARAALVRTRTSLLVCVQNLAKSAGLKIPSGSSDSFYRRAIEALPESLRQTLEPILNSIKTMTLDIRRYDNLMRKVGEDKYPEVAPLLQVNGVGIITALTFILLLEDPNRFPNGRAVGAYLGLTPRRRQSGDRDPKLGISKTGDTYMRALLVQCAQYILGPFGQDSELRRKGMRILERGGKGAKKRAVVAVARSLACVLHRLWVTGEAYKPFPNGKPAKKEAA